MFDILSGSHTPFEGVSNGKHGHSGGSMNNSMYRRVCVKNATFEPWSGRTKKRLLKKRQGVCLHKNKEFWDL